METKHAAGPRRKSELTAASQYAEADRAICGRGTFILIFVPVTRNVASPSLTCDGEVITCNNYSIKWLLVLHLFLHSQNFLFFVLSDCADGPWLTTTA